MLYTGLTYCGHPLACAAARRAAAYEDENLISSRARWRVVLANFAVCRRGIR